VDIPAVVEIAARIAGPGRETTAEIECKSLEFLLSIG
jgi:hypothetical protein